jgi:hypothetical protein
MPRAGSAYRDRLGFYERNRGPARPAFTPHHGTARSTDGFDPSGRSLGSNPSRNRVHPQGRCALRPCGLRAPALSGCRDGGSGDQTSHRLWIAKLSGQQWRVRAHADYLRDRRAPPAPRRLSAAMTQPPDELRQSMSLGQFRQILVPRRRAVCEVGGGLPRHRFHQRWVGIEQVCQEVVRRSDRDAKCGERREIEVLQVVRHQYAGRDRRRGGGDVPVLRV